MILFDGVDVLIDGDIDDATLRRALALALNLPEARVDIVHDIADYPERGAADAVGVASLVEGDFSVLLSIQAANLELAYNDPLDPVREFCKTIGVRCLVPDDAQNPYAMWLVNPGKEVQSANLDPAALEDGRYVLQ